MRQNISSSATAKTSGGGGTPAAAVEGLLVAVTENRSEVEMDQYVAAFTQAIAAAAGANT